MMTSGFYGSNVRGRFWATALVVIRGQRGIAMLAERGSPFFCRNGVLPSIHVTTRDSDCQRRDGRLLVARKTAIIMLANCVVSLIIVVIWSTTTGRAVLGWSLVDPGVSWLLTAIACPMPEERERVPKQSDFKPPVHRSAAGMTCAGPVIPMRIQSPNPNVESANVLRTELIHI